jgi:hypothetical protein
MLAVAGADIRSVLHRVLVLAATICCGLVLISFGLFALDQVSGASKHQQAELVGASTAPGVTVAHRPPAQPRRFIDDAAHALTSPFSSILQTDSQWSSEMFTTVLALLVYGVGLGYLARFSRGVS